MSETTSESPLRGAWTITEQRLLNGEYVGLAVVGLDGKVRATLPAVRAGSPDETRIRLIARAIAAVPDLVDAAVLVSEWTHQVNPDEAAATIAEAQMIVGATFALDAIFPDTPEGHAALDQYHRRPAPAAKEPQ